MIGLLFICLSGPFIPDPAHLPWLKEFFHHLLKTDVCVLFKAYPESRKELSLPSR